MSLADELPPDADAVAVALQVLPFTLQLTDAAAQAAGAGPDNLLVNKLLLIWAKKFICFSKSGHVSKLCLWYVLNFY
jgi:hypothetical protein